MVIVNNKSYVGNCISITNSRIVVNGVDVTPENDKVINITVDGDCENIEADACTKIEVKGSVTKGGIRTMSGDIDVAGNVDGNITTQSGDVESGGDVTGSVSTMSGDVKCGDIGGSVSTLSGDIKNKK